MILRIHIALAITTLVLSCSSDSPDESRSNDRQQTPAQAPPTETPKEPPVEIAPLLPLPVPQAYFGELDGLTRLGEPLNVKRTKGNSVVLVVFDTLNARHLGVYGYSRDTSPGIDSLSQEGLVLTNYISNSSWTRPSMATIMTGLPKKKHKLELNCPPMSEDITTLAERFQKAGYRTAGFVGNPLIKAKWGFGQGFDTYVDAKVLQNYKLADDADLAKRAISWLEKNGDQPFFLFVFFTAPHSPYSPPKGFGKFFKGLPKGWPIRIPRREYPGGMDPGDRAWTVAAYDGDVLYGDAQLRKLIAHLKKTGLFETTTVAVTADHGEIFGEHNCFMHSYHMWEPVLRVPFVISSPALPVKGAYDDRPFTHLDVAPTLLDLVGIDLRSHDLVGKSMAQVFEDPRSGRERELFSQYNAHDLRREAIREGRWKLVHHHPVPLSSTRTLNMFGHTNKVPPKPGDLPTVSWEVEKYELFDLESDPGELQDLFESRKTEAQTVDLISALAKHLEDNPDKKIEMDEDLKKALGALGYIGLADDDKKDD